LMLVPASVWNKSVLLNVGSSGPGNRLLVADGGTVFASDAVNVGFQTTTSSNNLLPAARGTLRAQNPGGTGTLDIRSGTNRFDAGLIEVDRVVMTNSRGL